MKAKQIIFGVLCAGLEVIAPSAHAASPQPVSDWSNTGFPSDVSMYAYVPAKVAQNPPLLTIIHYCGGTAQAVFGQAAGLVKAADQYGFVIVLPSSGRCWDVVSDKTRKRDGGGDSHAIKEMVKFGLQKYKANPDRVYATGDSSGGMMTELLMALYPEIFKAGAAFAGMPAGCRGANESGSGGGYSGACAGGSVSHTAMEWGDIARMLDPGYTGHRPRLQLFHGSSDGTISFKNHGEAIKEWSNVLGLSESPAATDMGLTLGTHQATRQRWKNACGYEVLDAFTSINGDHGPSDALFEAQYVVPFLGLDKTGPVDPEIEKCAGAAGGSGGAGAGGAAGAGTGGSGGSANSGGASAGGAGGAAGNPSAGGSNSSGSSSGGSNGLAGSGGAPSASSGANAGGSSAVPTGAAGNAPGAAGSQSTPSSPSTDSGCSFGRSNSEEPLTVAALALALAFANLRRRKTA